MFQFTVSAKFHALFVKISDCFFQQMSQDCGAEKSAAINQTTVYLYFILSIGFLNC